MPPAPPSPKGARPRPASRALGAERRAELLLESLGLRAAPVPVELIALRLGLHVQRERFGDDVSGVLVVQDGRGVIGVNAGQAPVRQRFTIAHEIGHYELHRHRMAVFIDKQFLGPMFAVFRDGKSATGEDQREREANAFAAGLLMPERLVMQAVTHLRADVEDESVIEELARHFDVSRQAMTFRVANLMSGARR